MTNIFYAVIYKQIFSIKKNALFTLMMIQYTILFTIVIFLSNNSILDSVQNVYYYIIYVHVPCSWLSILIYVVASILSLVHIIKRDPLLFSKIGFLIELCIVYTIISIVTGSIWGSTTWGTYWVWDARLTTMLIHLVVQVLLLGFFSKIQNMPEMHKYISFAVLIGLMNLILVKWSVEWWTTLHQGATFSSTTVETNGIISTLLLLSFLSLCTNSLYNFLIKVKVIKIKRKYLYKL